MRSVRRRLLAWLVAGFAVLVAGAGYAVARVVEDRATEEFDATLHAKARALGALTEQEGGRIEFDYGPTTMPEFERERAPEHFQFWLDDGLSLLKSKRLPSDLPRESRVARSPAFRDIVLPDGRAGRMVQIAHVPRGPLDAGDVDDVTDPASLGPTTAKRAVVLAVARGREGLDTVVGGVRTAIWGVGGLAVLLAALWAWRVLAAGFRPIDSIAAQVERLDADRLSTRVALEDPPIEVEAVARQVNALLDRLGAALEREKRFAGHVAHELRTPIAELRSLASVGARWPDDRVAVARFFADVNEVAGRMERLVTDLLLLARVNAGVEAVSVDTLSLADAVRAAWAPHASRASARRVRLVADVPEDLFLESDPVKLGIVLSNLFSNAVEYARGAGEVRAVARREGARFRLDVENEAEPLAPGDIDRLTEPFWRGAAARAAEDHAGLGLSLVAALSPLLRLTASFAQDAEGRFCARIEGDATDRPPVAEPAPAPDLAISDS